MNAKVLQLLDTCKLAVDYSSDDDRNSMFECTCYVPNAPDEWQPEGIEKTIPYDEFQKRFSDTKNGQILVTDSINSQEAYYMPFWKWFSEKGWKAQKEMFETFINEKENRTQIYLPRTNDTTYEQAKESAIKAEFPDVPGLIALQEKVFSQPLKSK